MGIRKNIFSLFALLLTFVFVNGCATTGLDRSVKASNSIQEVDKEIRNLIVQIDATNTSLDTLMNSATPDLKKNFDVYSDNVNKLEKQGKLEMKRMDEMQLRSKEYFAEWEKQGNTYTNSEIRELSEERRNELAALYAQVPESAVGIRGAYFDYLKDLKEIQMYLSNDLTPKGIETITPVVDKTKPHMETLKSSFRPVIKALDEIKSELYIKKK